MMKWFWDAYTTDPKQRREIHASPLLATTEQLKGLPPALGCRRLARHCIRRAKN
jgi:acetyl esterase